MLREQLEQAGVANEALSQDIRRLTTDWTKAREELEQKESDWRREEEVRGRRERGGGARKKTQNKTGGRFKTQELMRMIFFPHPVFSQLLQQRAQPAAGAVATSGRLPEERVRAEEFH